MSCRINSFGLDNDPHGCNVMPNNGKGNNGEKLKDF